MKTLFEALTTTALLVGIAWAGMVTAHIAPEPHVETTGLEWIFAPRREEAIGAEPHYWGA